MLRRYVLHIYHSTRLADIHGKTPKPKKSIKVKLNPTPKAANGTGTPKSTKKEKAESAAKPKSTKKAAAKKSDGETSTPAKVEDTRTPEEIHKTKEVCTSRKDIDAGALKIKANHGYTEGSHVPTPQAPKGSSCER